jgi:hypothetical protein
MEHSIWRRLKCFIQESLSEKFKVFFPGMCMGFFGAKSLLFSGISAEMVTFGTYVLKYIGTVIMAFSSGLATAYAALLIEKHKERQKKSPIDSVKRKKAA